MDLNKFAIYEELLGKWQKSINLVGKSTLADMRRRHFQDSARLLPLIPNGTKVADLGSGAGFPGMVLAVLGVADMTLIEKDARKCVFLQEVARAYDISPCIINKRIEDFYEENKKFDIVCARALGSLDLLLNYAVPLLHTHSRCIFLKGLNAEKEIKTAQKHYMFHVEHITDPTGSGGEILILSDIKIRSDL